MELENSISDNAAVGGERDKFAQANLESSSRLLDEQLAPVPKSSTTADKAVCGVGLAAWTYLTVDTMGLATPGLLWMGYQCRNEIKDVLGMNKSEKR